jgi:Family of unknown function (DUF6529)
MAAAIVIRSRGIDRVAKLRSGVSFMSDNVDNAPRRASPARLFAAPLLLFAGVSLAVCLLAAHADDDPYRTPFFHLFFSNTLHMKAWLTTGAALLGVAQLATAARIYGKLHFLPDGRFYALAHRWSGRIAVLLTLPAAYHCIFKLGFATYDARAALHSTLGAAFYGAVSAKVFIVRSSDFPGWALPVAGATLFAFLMLLWLTSAFWLFSAMGVSL